MPLEARNEVQSVDPVSLKKEFPALSSPLTENSLHVPAVELPLSGLLKKAEPLRLEPEKIEFSYALIYVE